MAPNTSRGTSNGKKRQKEYDSTVGGSRRPISTTQPSARDESSRKDERAAHHAQLTGYSTSSWLPSLCSLILRNSSESRKSKPSSSGRDDLRIKFAQNRPKQNCSQLVFRNHRRPDVAGSLIGAAEISFRNAVAAFLRHSATSGSHTIRAAIRASEPSSASVLPIKYSAAKVVSIALCSRSPLWMSSRMSFSPCTPV